MFEVIPAVPLEEVIDLRAEAIKVEIRQMAVAAMHAIDRSLGLPPAFTNRSLAQRRRFARARVLKESP